MADEGSWTGPPKFEYQWLRCMASDPNSCTPIASEITKEYGVQPADVGSRIRVEVTAQNKRNSGQRTAAKSIPSPVVMS